MYFTGDQIEKVRRRHVRDDERHLHVVRSRSAGVVHSRKARTRDRRRLRAHAGRLVPHPPGPAVLDAAADLADEERPQPGIPDPARGAVRDVRPRLETAYFMPFGDSIDATVTADLGAGGYFGAGVKVRYLPSQDVKIGELSANVVRDPHPERLDSTPNAVGPVFHWRYRYQHAQDNLPGGFRGVIDVEDFSNLDFFRKYERDPRLHTLSNIYSSAYLTKNRSPLLAEHPHRPPRDPAVDARAALRAASLAAVPDVPAAGALDAGLLLARVIGLASAHERVRPSAQRCS